jgi:hypothetical protein
MNRYLLLAIACGALVIVAHDAQPAAGGAKCPALTKTVTVYAEGYGQTKRDAIADAKTRLAREVAKSGQALRGWSRKQRCNAYCPRKGTSGVRAEKVREGVKPSTVRMKGGIARIKGPIYSARRKKYVEGFSEDLVVLVSCSRS